MEHGLVHIHLKVHKRASTYLIDKKSERERERWRPAVGYLYCWIQLSQSHARDITHTDLEDCPRTSTATTVANITEIHSPIFVWMDGFSFGKKTAFGWKGDGWRKWKDWKWDPRERGVDLDDEGLMPVATSPTRPLGMWGSQAPTSCRLLPVSSSQLSLPHLNKCCNYCKKNLCTDLTPPYFIEPKRLRIITIISRDWNHPPKAGNRWKFQIRSSHRTFFDGQLWSVIGKEFPLSMQQISLLSRIIGRDAKR